MDCAFQQKQTIDCQSKNFRSINNAKIVAMYQKKIPLCKKRQKIPFCTNKKSRKQKEHSSTKTLSFFFRQRIHNLQLISDPPSFSPSNFVDYSIRFDHIQLLFQKGSAEIMRTEKEDRESRSLPAIVYRFLPHAEAGLLFGSKGE